MQYAIICESIEELEKYEAAYSEKYCTIEPGTVPEQSENSDAISDMEAAFGDLENAQAVPEGKVYDPMNPLADENGYIDVVEEVTEAATTDGDPKPDATKDGGEAQTTETRTAIGCWCPGCENFLEIPDAEGSEKWEWTCPVCKRENKTFVDALEVPI